MENNINNTHHQAPNVPKSHFKSPKANKKKILYSLFALVLLAGLIFGGWWQMQTIADLRNQVKNLQEQNAALQGESATVDTVNWPKYSNLTGEYAFSYKPDWLLLVCAGNEATVFIAPDEESQALCATEKFSPISVTSIEGDQRALDEDEIKTYATDVVVTTATIGGVEGTKATYTHSGNEFVAAGVKYIQYEFFTNGRTYTLSYSDGETDADLSADFEALVQTIEFSIN